MNFKVLMAPVAGLAFALSFAVTTANAALATSCVGTAATSSITWSALSTGGVAPIAFLWGNGSTSTVQTVSGYAPGTQGVMALIATDASSTTAVTSCSVLVPTNLPVVLSFTATPDTVTLGQGAVLSWNVNNASSTSLNNGIGNMSIASTSITVTPTVTTTYILSTVNSNGTTTAAKTVTVISASSTPPTATTTVPVYRRSSLMINDSGRFFGKGMIVQSIGTGSFVAKVWGMTFNITSALPVVVGSYVDVRGIASESAPGTIVARSVKSFASFKTIMTKDKEEAEEQANKEMKKKNKGQVKKEMKDKKSEKSNDDNR